MSTQQTRIDRARHRAREVRHAASREIGRVVRNFVDVPQKIQPRVTCTRSCAAGTTLGVLYVVEVFQENVTLTQRSVTS